MGSKNANEPYFNLSKQRSTDKTMMFASKEILTAAQYEK
jgi:hypothetical protein